MKAFFLALILVAQLAHAAEPAKKLAKPVEFLQTEITPTTDKPWYSLDNLSIAAGGSYRWWNWGDSQFLSPKKEFVFGLYNAWQLTEHVDAIGNVEYGVDTRSTGFTVGLRAILKMPK